MTHGSRESIGRAVLRIELFPKVTSSRQSSSAAKESRAAKSPALVLSRMASRTSEADHSSSRLGFGNLTKNCIADICGLVLLDPPWRSIYHSS